jgi:tetratricopeptide (TPR) repeat protein
MAKGSKVRKLTVKKTKPKPKPVSRKPIPSRAKSGAKAPAKAKAPARAERQVRQPAAAKHMPVESKKVSVLNKIVDAPHLLRETKATAAALTLLEKGIKLIYQKDFKKARIELKSLLADYPGESEILARARIYLQICEREETAHRKPVIGNDQLYALGVIEHNRGNYDKAISHFRNSLDKHQQSDHIFYSLAASLAMKGEIAEALRNLQKAVELNEENRVYAKNDSDFTPLHGQKEFDDLVGWTQSYTGGQS